MVLTLQLQSIAKTRIIVAVKELKRILKERRCLVFIDLEATQTSHEVIQIGAYKTYLNDDLLIKKVFKPFELFVKPKHRVGKYVTELTGITDLQVKREGVTYRTALASLKKYCGRDYDKCLFVVYGNTDGSMLRATAENNMDASMQETMYIVHHIWDFCAYCSRYIKGQDGNPMSLTRVLEVFGIPFDGQAHSASADARNLMHLYQAFMRSPAILKREYKKTLTHYSGGNNVIREVITRLANGKDVSASDFDKIIEDSFR